jgi:hypothetical protein
MTDPGKYIEEDKISLKELIDRFNYWINYCLHNFKYILIAAVIGALLGYAYTFKRPTYFAETTFALEESSGFGLSQVAGLASAAGISLGPLGGGENGIFQGENIMQLYTSQRMIENALLSDVNYKGGNEKLIYTYARERKLDKQWAKKPYLKDISFDIPRDEFSRHQDSILFKVAEEIRERFLAVGKPVRRLNIISVTVNFKDPVFAKSFNEALVKNVNSFYFETKTRKTAMNVATLQTQADSIKIILDQYVSEMALAMDATPNPNVLNRSSRVPAQQKQMDLQSSLTAYAEIVKSLEVAKLNHLSKTPLLQIVDAPNEYLKNNKWKWYKGVVIGFFIGGFFSLAFITGRLIIRSALSEKEKAAQ